ncbi:calcium-binding protein [Methylobacterium sp. Leaf456]|uniref:M15 family metallopeptidase n=1 Tax=Methylobacterium sp. Leaf456 TaxID=1736382 RepID=UPI000A899B20|nr:calcium-binding protein [Methylobacterium sp. Leaf456]
MSYATYVKVKSTVSFHAFSPNKVPDNWGLNSDKLYYDGVMLTDVPKITAYASVSKGYWQPGQFILTGTVAAFVTRSVDLVIEQPSEDKLPYGPEGYGWNGSSGPQYTWTMHDDLFKSDYNGSITSYQWYNIYHDMPSLFTEKSETRDLNKLKASNFFFYSAGSSKNGNDVVTLPNSATKWSEWSISTSPDGRYQFDAGNGNDNITGGRMHENINGGAGDDTIRPGGGRDLVDGGSGKDTLVLDGLNYEYVLGGKIKSDNKHIVVQKQLNNKTVETDIIYNIEVIKFNNKQLKITKWSELVSLSTVKNLNINPDGTKLTTPTAALLEDLLGTPINNGNGTYAYSNHIKAMLARDKSSVVIDGVKYDTIKVVADSLTKIMNEASSIYGSLKGMTPILESLSSAGVLVPRKIDGKESFSSHSWGTSIDLKVDGILDYVADGQLHLALAKITPLFNKEGWVAGSGFSGGREDDMHFEFSTAKLMSLFADVKQGSAGKDAISGNNKDNYLVGNGGDDIIRGGNGIDTLKGGLGNDTLYGGKDSDFFVFDTILNAKNNVDRIMDFQSVDEIELDHAIFTKLGKSGHALDTSQFSLGDAKDINDYILYDQKSGALSYDADGNGAAKAVVFAVLENRPTNITHADFFVI